MGLKYPQLTYDADVTGSEQAQPGHLLGCDELGRFYEVIDAEVWQHRPLNPCACGRTRTHTHVNLQYATVETIRAVQARRSED